jgi:c-di-GMP-related signal transduction protein
MVNPGGVTLISNVLCKNDDINHSQWVRKMGNNNMVDYFFARQPIFDKTKSVFGYELLFRKSLQEQSNTSNGDQATLDILSNALFHASFKQMAAGKQGLVNFTRELLLSDEMFLFSPDELIIEVLEDVYPDNEIVNACKRLKDSKYKIALDDFIVKDLNNPLIPYADIIKVDFLQVKGQDRNLIAKRLLPLKIALLAEKVETNQDFHEASDLGYTLFQGYFFSKPIIQSGRRIEPNQTACIRMLQAVFKDQCNFLELNEIISGDMSLSYRMLKLANSPYFSFRTEIQSILHAITLMGCGGMKRFVSLIAIGSSKGNKPTELTLICLARARMCEQLAPLCGVSDMAAPLFLTGLFSLLDALLDCPMQEALAELPIAQEIKSALAGEPNCLRDILDVIVAYERGNWDQFQCVAKKIRLREEQFPPIYASAIEWAANILQSL